MAPAHTPFPDFIPLLGRQGGWGGWNEPLASGGGARLRHKPATGSAASMAGNGLFHTPHERGLPYA